MDDTQCASGSQSPLAPTTETSSQGRAASRNALALPNGIALCIVASLACLVSLRSPLHGSSASLLSRFHFPLCFFLLLHIHWLVSSPFRFVELCFSPPFSVSSLASCSSISTSFAILVQAGLP
ncbi:hypothetical protein BCV70DRAFT_63565 [Testicularia cyperi]|uniref:Uncharacterized protein n=1 Tax=Testicularia cyperi TaxID=1882483 RepID=A0A317XWS8_9BASI|nr:hypothetical protein BCV70DRAFT_63565 [Testicularia cyperi]